jgi:hypothetical protein
MRTSQYQVVRRLVHVNEVRFSAWTRILVGNFIRHVLPICTDKRVEIGFGAME